METERRIIRILYLNDDVEFLLYRAVAEVAVSHDLNFDFVEEIKDLGSESVYRPTPELCTQITRLTQTQQVDLVIIMNNNGAGLTKAQAVATQMRAKTVVIWGTTVSDEWKYQELGITHLGQQRELARLICAALGLPA